ncbi:DUF4268 domain-containing protein [Shimia aestuarii]|uniref:DUF4268 domain-containing protein n=1 Tax=Shimia aestuarii TaxID=254406 RepID=A0A1I4QQF2_9RHOB|nr:DUF4268 domain-containing protein [Shimia aestuarii]SFM42249.1 protein of unknown function [Shimia aestuarii]
MSRQVAKPILVYPDGRTVSPTKLDLGKPGTYTEYDLQEALFSYPELLPVAEIDPAFKTLIPICTELSMKAGRLDVLYVTPDGLPVCVETKLWRNAEARRAVVAQILDYASELSRWSVEDLQRVVRQRTKRHLFDIVANAVPGIDEAEFLDNITSALQNGRFLLLVCGDGIRESTENISRFLSGAGHLDFIFALVEVGVFETEDGVRIYQPRTLARTQKIQRSIDRSLNNNSPILDESEFSNEPVDHQENIGQNGEDKRKFWLEFWEETSAEIDFDDPNHLEFTPEKRFRAAGVFGNVAGVYLLTYFSTSDNEIGVALSFNREARPLFEALKAQKDGLEEQIGYPLKWTVKENGRQMIGTKTEYQDPKQPEQREAAKKWFAKRIVDFDNVLRPALENFDY